MVNAPMPTHLLTRSDILALVHFDALLPALKEGFRARATTPPQPSHRWRAALPSAGNAMLLAPGLADGIPAYTVKVNAKFPQQSPAIRGTILLHDLHTGALLAILESGTITALRTGMAGALAADVLARSDAKTIAIIGAGVQGRYLLEGWAHLRRVEQVWVYDTDPIRAEIYQSDPLWKQYGLSVRVAERLENAVANADCIFTATWAQTPFLFSSFVPLGTHITTLGADEPNKCEVAAELIEQAYFVCDNRDLALTVGAIAGAGLGDSAIDAELGEVLAGTHAGRTDAQQITVYGGVGMAWQDLIVAWNIYQRALAQGVGREIEFL